MITFVKENVPLATPGLVRTGSALVMIGKSKVEIYQMQMHKRTYRYDVYVNRDGKNHVYYPKSYVGVEEILEIVSQYEHEQNTL